MQRYRPLHIKVTDNPGGVDGRGTKRWWDSNLYPKVKQNAARSCSSTSNQWATRPPTTVHTPLCSFIAITPTRISTTCIVDVVVCRLK